MTSSRSDAVSMLNRTERFFLRVFCHSPPENPYEPQDDYDANPPPIDQDPLRKLRQVFDSRFEDAVDGKIMFDIGCGPGAQVIGAAMAGSKHAVGFERTEVDIRIANAHATTLGVKDKVQFTTDPMSKFGTNWADVALSQNAFEHFDKPDEILEQAYVALRPGGQFFISFGPIWWHPFGVHHMFMIRLPWAHLFFSEQTILRVRQLYRPNRPTNWQGVSLNQMTVSKFLALIEATPFELSDFLLTPIKPLPRAITGLRLFREWTNSGISVILTKPGDA